MKGKPLVPQCKMRFQRSNFAASDIILGVRNLCLQPILGRTACEGLLCQYLGSFINLVARHSFINLVARHPICMHQCPVASVNPLHLPDLPYACRDVAPEWRCEVLFCDDSSRFESLNQLTERHTELAARRQQLQAKLDSANRVGA